MPADRNSSYTASIIGCGGIGYQFNRNKDLPGARTHFGALKKSDRFKIVGIAEVNVAIRDEIRMTYGIPGYADYREMLSTWKPDLVVLATPDETHPQILSELPAYQPKLVFCEKPLASTSSEMDALVASYDAAGIGLAVNYTRRFIPEYVDFKRRISSGELGRVYSVVIYYSRGFVHNACHYLDLLRWWFGEAKDFMVEGARNGLNETDPTLSVLIHYDSGLEVRLVGLESNDILVNEIDIIGTEGRIRIGTLDSFSIETVQRHPDYDAFRCYTEKARGRIDRSSALPRAFDNLCLWLDGKTELLTPGGDSVPVQRLIEGILR